MTYKFEIPPYFTQPVLKKKTPKLTAKEIIASASPNTIKLGKKVAITDAIIKRTPKALSEYGYTTYRLNTRNMENGHQYRITILSDTPIIKSTSKLIIDSPNPKWVFYYEYAMAKRGNAFIYRSNGDPPVVKNPSQKPGIDHHVYASIKYLSKNSKEIMQAVIAEKARIAKEKAKLKARQARR
jgi:hypothetical protein